MIYSNYNSVNEEFEEDFFAEGTNYGISIPSGLTNAQQDAFMAGLAEASMLSSFERIGAHEAYCLENSVPVNENAVFDAIKNFFGKILEAIKKFFAGIIQWIKDKSDEFARKMREKKLDKVFGEGSKFKSNLINGGAKLETEIITTKLINKSTCADWASLKSCLGDINQVANAVTKEADAILNDRTKIEDGTDLKKIVFGSLNSNSSSIDDYKKDIAAEYEKEVKITLRDAIDMSGDLKTIVLNGSQKSAIKKIFETEKKAINKLIAQSKKAASKDDKTIKSKVAAAKDCALILDAIGRLLGNYAQKAYAEAGSVISAMVKYVNKNKKPANESVDFMYRW